MEAVAAVGVAAAAAQFLDFSTKIIALCKEIRDSSTGSTEANAELTKSVKQLKEIQEPLRQAGNTSSSTYRQLVRAVQECSRVANELLQLLEDISEVARKSFGPMRSAFRAMKERKTVEKLQKRLMDCQEKFRVALTIDIRQSVAESLEKRARVATLCRTSCCQSSDNYARISRPPILSCMISSKIWEGTLHHLVKLFNAACFIWSSNNKRPVLLSCMVTANSIRASIGNLANLVRQLLTNGCLPGSRLTTEISIARGLSRGTRSFAGKS
jgi:hypothetical protein